MKNWFKNSWLALFQILFIIIAMYLVVGRSELLIGLLDIGNLTNVSEPSILYMKLWIITAAFFTIIVTCIANITMAAEEKGKKFIRITVALIAIFLLVMEVFTSVAVWTGAWTVSRGILFVGVISVLLICIIDCIIAWLYDNKNMKGNFWKILWGLDLPILAGVIIATMFERNLTTYQDFSNGYCIGAITLQIIIGNVAYAFLGIGGFIKPNNMGGQSNENA